MKDVSKIYNIQCFYDRCKRNPVFQFYGLKKPSRTGVYTMYFDCGIWFVRCQDLFVRIVIKTPSLNFSPK